VIVEVLERGSLVLVEFTHLGEPTDALFEGAFAVGAVKGQPVSLVLQVLKGVWRFLVVFWA
jgi:hypothetical protein